MYMYIDIYSHDIYVYVYMYTETQSIGFIKYSIFFPFSDNKKNKINSFPHYLMSNLMQTFYIIFFCCLQME